MFSVEAEGLGDLAARFAPMPAAVQAALAAKAAELSQKLQAHVVQDKLSGQVLQVKTGALRNSIRVALNVAGPMVEARVSSGDVKYAAIQEFGGRTSPHDIVPNKAKALAFTIGGQTIFAKIVHHPGSNLPARSYLRSALADMAAEITGGLRSAALQAMQP